MNIKEKILLESKIWVQEKLSLDQNHFTHFSRLHAANILWIGSSDSLVSVHELTNAEPGQILIHRNMANQVREDDMSLMATIEHAVEEAGVEYIILCGYSHCRGIQSVTHEEGPSQHVRKWLSGLRELYERQGEELWSLPLEEKKRQLSELNIRQQIHTLSQLEIIQRAWKNKGGPELLGWYFDLNNGAIKEVLSVQAEHKQLKQLASV